MVNWVTMDTWLSVPHLDFTMVRTEEDGYFRTFSNARYHTGDKWIRLSTRATRCNEASLIAILNHEIMHKILDEYVGSAKASAYYDKLSVWDENDMFVSHAIDNDYHETDNPDEWRGQELTG
jgi:hypothetical protein